MKKFAGVLILILMLILGILITIAIISNSRDPYGEAAIIAAQGQSRLDTAMGMAGVIGAAGVVTVAIIGTVGFLVLAGILIHATGALATTAITGVVAMMQSRPHQQAPPQIIERQIVLLPGGSQAALDIWVQSGEQNYQIIRKENR
ncbi:MAG: hypothetical protein Kow0031_21930 [Anaerolineae bacterium]